MHCIMKLPSILSLAAVSAALMLTSCETTGDPTQGGLFGWSQTKANYRQQALRDELAYKQNQAAYQQGKSDALESELRRKKNSQSNSW